MVADLPNLIAGLAPQSNQRGIEMVVCAEPSPTPTAPQSNQRGIEITDRNAFIQQNIPASIEPAWD